MSGVVPNSKLLERIRSRCTEDKINGCWLYELSINGSGYLNTIRAAACFGGNGEMVQSARLAYEALKGPIPEDLQIDHLCKQKTCLNPHHLEPVSPSVNIARRRIGEPHPLSAWLFPSPEIRVPTWSSTAFIFAST
jgi:HNH endonuclease